ncbi:MAG: VOC family protein [Gammaproteobacteria bacterium]|nr:VOC family protein [Gammaproteobacteria bacterium]
MNFGIWRRDHELVPTEYQTIPQGIILIFVVDDCDAVYTRAVEKQIAIIRPPKDLFYGQRSFLARDPNGVLIDVSTPARASREFLDSHRHNPIGVGA